MKEKFGARTILIPLMAVFVFFAIQFVTYLAYLAGYAIFSSIGSVSESFEQILDESLNIMYEHSNIITAISSIITIMFAVVVFLLIKRSSKNILRTDKVSFGIWIAGIFSILGLGGFVFLQLAGIAYLGEQIPVIGDILKEYTEMSELFIVSRNIPLVIISTCILVPIAEELVFRGIIQGELVRAMPAALAIFIQAFIFAIIHGNIIQISYVLIPGIVLGAIYHWTKSIYVPIVLHMIFNFFGSALPMILENNEMGQTFLILSLFAMIPVGFISLIYVFMKRKKDTPVSDELPEHLVTQPAQIFTVSPNQENKWKHKDV